MDSNFSEQLTVGLICAVVSALVAAVVQRALDRRDRGSWSGSRTWVDVRIHIDSKFEHSSQRHPPRGRSTSDTHSDIELVVLAVVGVFGAASVLFEFRDDLIAALIVGTGLLGGALVGALGYFIALRALTGWEWAAFVISSLLVLACGAAGARALDAPTFENYQELIRAYERGGLGDVTDRFGVDGVFFAAYQLIGVALLAVAALAVVSALLFVVARINYVLDARGRWLWSMLVRASLGRGRPIPLLVGAGVSAVFSFLFTSGLLYDVVNHTANGG